MHFPYVLVGFENLADEVRKPVSSVLVRCGPNGQPEWLVLWREDYAGLQISSEVHDVAEGLEIGNIRFALVTESAEPGGLWKHMNFASPFFANSILTATKLTIAESGSTAEGGII